MGVATRDEAESGSKGQLPFETQPPSDIVNVRQTCTRSRANDVCNDFHECVRSQVHCSLTTGPV